MHRRCFLSRTIASLAAGVTLPTRSWAATPAAEPAWKFAICNETFGDWPFAKAFAFAAQCGYTGLEVAPFTLANDVREVSPARRAEFRRQANAAGLKIIGLHWLLAKTNGFHLTSPDDEVRRQTADYLGDLARFCAELGGTILVFGSPKQRDLLPGVSREAALGHAVDTLQRVLPVLEKTDTLLAFEPLKPGTTTFINTAAEGRELARRVGSPRCKLHLDCLAMAAEPTPIPEIIRREHADVVHFHANDPNGQGPGFGQLDFVPIFQALREVNYRGWISVEVFNTKPGPERLAKESIDYLRRCAAKM